MVFLIINLLVCKCQIVIRPVLCRRHGVKVKRSSLTSSHIVVLDNTPAA